MKKGFTRYFSYGKSPTTNGAHANGFTILELAIVIVIMTMLSSLMFVSFNTARKTNRDSKRVSDVKEMQGALAMYYRDWGTYPLASAVTAGATFASGTIAYLTPWPANPSPRADGSCPDTDYVYALTSNGSNSTSSYSIKFCLGATNSDIGAGTSYAIPDDILTCVPNCVLSCLPGLDGCGGTCTNVASCSAGYTCTSSHCVKN